MTLVAMSKITVMENPRQVDGVDDFIGTPLSGFPTEYAEEVMALAESIRLDGLINPITVKDLGGGNRYRLIAGNRRFKACQYLGMRQVDTKSVKGKTDQEQVIALIENVHRKDLPPIDIARALDKMRTTLGITKQSELAVRVSKSQAWVSQHLALLKAHPDLVEAMDKGEIGMAAARTLTSLPKEEQSEALSEAKDVSAKNGKSKVTTRSARRSYTRKKKAKKGKQQDIRPLEERQLEQRAACIRDFLDFNWPTPDDKPPQEAESIARMFWDYLMDKERLIIRP